MKYTNLEEMVIIFFMVLLQGVSVDFLLLVLNVIALELLIVMHKDVHFYTHLNTVLVVFIGFLWDDRSVVSGFGFCMFYDVCLS